MRILAGAAALVVGLAVAAGADRRADAGAAVAAACAARGPTPPGAPLAAAERAAVPLAFRGVVVVSVASRDRLTILDLATGRQRSVPSGIDFQAVLWRLCGLFPRAYLKLKCTQTAGRAASGKKRQKCQFSDSSGRSA